MPDDNIGSVSVSVTPDATAFFARFREQTKEGASRGIDVKVNPDTKAADAELTAWRSRAGRNVDVKVNVNSSSLSQAQRQTNLLRDAIVFLGPAAIPVAGVLSGAFAGLIPVAATLALGIKGISDEFKSGALEGTRYGDDIDALSDEFSTLKTNAAGGLLQGVDDALKTSAPLFKGLNQDVGVMSAQLGQIVSGAAPALLSILSALNPLFTTFGTLISDGAAGLEHWATSSGGVESFVAYVQAELPNVVHSIGQLVEFAGHLVEAFAPVGHVILGGLGMLAGILNSIPISVLQTMVPLLLAGYAAFRVYRGVDAIVARFSAGLASMQASVAANTLVVESNALAVQAAMAQEASIIAVTKAAEATAAAEAAVEIAAAAQAAGAAEAGLSAIIAENAIEQAAAFQLTADAAVLSATEISASAEASAAAVAESGAVARVGWASMLGPLAAVGVGVLLLTSIFGGNNEVAQENQKIMDGYAQSLKQSANALALVNIQETAKNLHDQGALKLMDQLNGKQKAVLGALAGSTRGLKLTQSELVLAVNGTKQQYDTLYGSLIKVADANKQTTQQARGPVAAYNTTGQAALDLAAKIKQLRGDMTAEMKVQADLAAIQKQAQIAINGGASATAAHARALHLTTDEYLAAQQAAQKNIDTTRAQTAAFQLDNAAGSLLQQTLDKLAGKNLSYAQAQNAFESQLVTMAQNLKGAKKGIEGLGSAAIQNRGNLLSLVQGAEQSAEAYGTMTKSSEKGRQKLIELRQQIIDNAVAHGENRKQVVAYIDSVLKIPAKLPPTKFDADTAAAKSKIADLKSRISAIRQGKVPSLAADPHSAYHVITDLQHKIDALRGKKINITVGVNNDVGKAVHDAVNNIPGQASGGGVPEGWSAVGEQGAELVHKDGATVQVFSNSQSKQIIAQTGMRPPGFAGGTGIVTLDPTGKQIAAAKAKAAAKVKADIVYTVEGQQYSSLQAAENAASRLFKAQVSLGLKIDGKDLTSFKASLKGTASQAHAAFVTIYNDAKKLGISDGLAAALRRENKKLDTEISARNKAADNLAKVKAKFADLLADVKSAFAGSFDIATAGTGFDGAQPVTGSNILAQALQDANKAKLFAKDIKSLAGKLDAGALRALASKGPDALPQAEALLDLNSTQLKQLKAADASIAASGTTTGNLVGNKLFGADISKYTKQVSADNKAILHEYKLMTAQIKHAVDHLDDRPINIVVDGKVIAKATASGTKKNARRK